MFGALAGVVVLAVGVLALGPLGNQSATVEFDVAHAPPTQPTPSPTTPLLPNPTMSAPAVPAPAPTPSPMVVPTPSGTEYSMLDPGVPDGDFPIIDGGPDVDYDIWVVQPGDNLADIARSVYGDPTAFGIIADANDLAGDTPLQVGQELVIPPHDSAGLPAPPTLATQPLDEELDQAIVASAQPPWAAVPSPAEADASVWEARGERIAFQLALPPQGQSAAAFVEQEIRRGAGEVDVGDGSTAALRNRGPAWPEVGPLFLALEDGRLLQVTGNPAVTGADPELDVALDYLAGDLIPWLSGIRAATSD